MNEAARRDKQLLVLELLRPEELIVRVIIAAGVVYLSILSFDAMPIAGVGLLALAGAVLMSHYFASVRRASQRQFYNARFKQLWSTCEERLKKFDEAIKQSSKSNIATFEELPKNIHVVAKSLYQALRRADLIAHEVVKSEGWMSRTSPPQVLPPSDDPQAQELYRLADKNIAEYRSHLSGVTAGIQRTEAQAVVFTTTLDNLRLKMLGYRLTSKDSGLSSEDFLFAISEAKLQLQSIDRALDELELGPYPSTISVMKEPPPETVHADLKQQILGSLGQAVPPPFEPEDHQEQRH